MKSETNAILVPWDFTEKCDFALKHAVNFAKAINDEILLVHFTSGSKVQSAKSQLAQIASANEAATGVKTGVEVKTGNVIAGLSEFSNATNASLVVMKTDGVKGTQKYFGSRAMKVVFGTKVPSIVVQAPPRRDEYKIIVFPIDYSFESKEKLHWVKWISKIYKTQIQIITPDIADGTLRNKIKNNVIFAKNIMSDEGIDYEIIVGAGKGDFAKATMDFAGKAEADLIMAMMPKDIGFRDYLAGGRTQKTLANPQKTPIFTINPRQLRKFGSFR